MENLKVEPEAIKTLTTSQQSINNAIINNDNNTVINTNNNNNNISRKRSKSISHSTNSLNFHQSIKLQQTLQQQQLQITTNNISLLEDDSNSLIVNDVQSWETTLEKAIKAIV